ncbi:similar to AHNAK nucleoprotein isoform 1 [Ectocarpus siliculosus]|uniref:Similar to AHNAK nucleoprotein isoform 1 n=1 Tax=Ectocarpus siliculosus TaxID=2880 RepID=D8LGV2_ECTSI|nr:similar to AHNAK nucleoprotein isoform 1 [Ectocarpus siliculosus]|eukprot:CBN75805.1 similar to AHNAK nucleoprotein isoform 1 [Ectocarpus siliculosus]
MSAPETGDASVPDTAGGGGGVVPPPDTAADSAEPPVDGGVPITASSSGVPADVESNDLGSTPDASSSATGTAPASVSGLPADDAGVPPADVVVPTADNEISASVGGADGSSAASAAAAAAADSVVLGGPPPAAEVPFSGDTPPLSVAIPEKGVAEGGGGGGGGDASIATAAGLDLGDAAAAVSGAVNDAVGAGQSNGQPDDAERQTPLVDAGLAATSDAPSSASKKGKKSKFGLRKPSFLKRTKSSTSEVPASDASGGVLSSAGDTPLSSASLETPSGYVHASTPSSSAQSVVGDPTTEEGTSTGASAEAKKPKRGLFGGLSLKKKSSSKGKGKLEVPEVALPDVLAVADTGGSLPQAPESVAEPISAVDVSVPDGGSASLPESSGDLSVPGTKEAPTDGDVRAPRGDVGVPLPEASCELSVPGTTEASIGGDLPVPFGDVSVPEMSASLPEESGDVAVPDLVVPGSTEGPSGVDVPVPSGDMGVSVPEASGDLSVPGTSEASIGGGVPMPSGDVSVAPDVSVSLTEGSGDLSVPGTAEASIGGDVPVPSGDMSASLPEASEDLMVTGTAEVSVGGEVPVPSGDVSAPDMNASMPEGSGDLAVPSTTETFIGVDMRVPSDDASVVPDSGASVPKASGDLSVPGTAEASIGGDLPVPSSDVSVLDTSASLPEASGDLAVPGTAEASIGRDVAGGDFSVVPDISASLPEASGDLSVPGTKEASIGRDLPVPSSDISASLPEASGELSVPDTKEPSIGGDVPVPSGDLPVPDMSASPPEDSGDFVVPGTTASLTGVSGTTANEPGTDYATVSGVRPSASPKASGDLPVPDLTDSSPPPGISGDVAAPDADLSVPQTSDDAQPSAADVADRSVSVVGEVSELDDGAPLAGDEAAAAAAATGAAATAGLFEPENVEKLGPTSAVVETSGDPALSGDDVPPVSAVVPAEPSATSIAMGDIPTAVGGEVAVESPSAAAAIEEKKEEGLEKGGPPEGSAAEEGAADAVNQPVEEPTVLPLVDGLPEDGAEEAEVAGVTTADGTPASAAAVDIVESAEAVDKVAVGGAADNVADNMAAADQAVVTRGGAVTVGALANEEFSMAAGKAGLEGDDGSLASSRAAAAAAAAADGSEGGVSRPALSVDDPRSTAAAAAVVVVADGDSPLPLTGACGEGATAPEAFSGRSSGSTDELLMPAASLDEEGAGGGVNDPVPTDGDFAVPPGAAGKERQPLAVEEQSAVAAVLEVTHSSPVDDWTSADNAAASVAVEVTRTARTTVDGGGGDSTPEVSVERNGGDGAEESAAAAAAAAAVASERLGNGTGEACVELDKSSSPVASPPQGIDGADERGDDMATGTGMQEGTQESGQGAAERDSASPGLPTGYATGGHPTEESMPSPSANQVPSTPQVRADVIGGGIGGRAPAVPPPSAGGTVREPVRRTGTAVPPNSAREAAAGAGEKDWLDELIEMISDKCLTCAVDDAS